MDQKSRSLTASQTLDEILGIGSSHSSSNSTEKNSLNSPIRPPTRHGRESSSSNEENKDPTFSKPSTAASERRESASKTSDDEFLQKLNEMRRRSLISINTTPAISETIKPSSSEPSPLRRLPVTVEDEEHEPQKDSLDADLSVSNASNRTFRVEAPAAIPSGAALSSAPPAAPSSRSGTKTTPMPRPRQSLQAPKSKPPPPPIIQIKARKDVPSWTAGGESSHHNKWLQKKMEEESAAKAAKRRAEETKKQAEAERRANAAKLFERWKADFDEKDKLRRAAERRKLNEAQRKQQEEKDRKRVEAQKTFEMWTRERSKSMVEMRRKVQEKDEQKRRAHDNVKQDKRAEADAAFKSWVRKKAKAQATEKAAREGKEKSLDEEIRVYKLLMAQEAYEAWLEMKEHERELQAEMIIESPVVPWIPPSNTVPRRFVATSNGRRLRKDVRQRSHSAKMRPATRSSLFR